MARTRGDPTSTTNIDDGDFDCTSVRSPKIDKTDNPLRMVVSLASSSSYDLSKCMPTYLIPIIAHSEHTISNSFEFLECINHIIITPDECMVSFDKDSHGKQSFTFLIISTLAYPIATTMGLPGHYLSNQFQFDSRFDQQTTIQPPHVSISAKPSIPATELYARALPMSTIASI